MINLFENPVRAVTLSATGVIGSMAISATLRAGLERVAPQLFTIDVNDDLSKKDVVKSMAMVIGTSVAITVIAGLAMSVVVNAMDDTFWPDTDIDLDIMDPTIE